MSAVTSCLLAAILVWSAIAKIARPQQSTEALRTFGITAARWQRLLWTGTVVLELLLAAGVALQQNTAAYAAAGVFVGYAVLLAGALRAGRSGRPCGCFGAQSKVSRIGVARNLVLAACFAAVPWLPAGWPSSQQLLAAGVLLSLAAALAMGVALIALAREVGMLRLAVGPQLALELPNEGPELYLKAEIDPTRFEGLWPGKFALAIFSSEGCSLCRSLKPAISLLAAGSDLLSVAQFDEVTDSESWQRLAVPGSPYAIVLSADLTVLAKGTFNSLAQLEGMIATAERRATEQQPIGVAG